MTGSDPNTKTVAVTAASLQTGGTRRKRKSSAYPAESHPEKQTRKERNHRGPAVISKEGGKQDGGTSPGTLVALAASHVPSNPNAPPPKPSNASNLSKAAANSTPAPVSSETTIVSGGAPKPQEASVKVILGEKKKKGTKVILSPTKVRKIPGLTTGGAPVNKTRKVAKKIRMSLGGFGKRVTRANSIRHEAKKQKIEDVKKTLVEAKLVKADSKAPETVLRQMYSDYMMLKNRAL